MKSEASGPIEQFATLLQESAARERAEQERRRLAREREREQAQRAAEHATAMETARRELERAIAGARDARRSGRGVADADAAWRRAKARVIELETGTPPDWARAGDGHGREPDGAALEQGRPAQPTDDPADDPTEEPGDGRAGG